MAIKNLDGSDYRLSKPNPLMAGQSLWGEDTVLHNRCGVVVTVPDKRQPVQQPKAGPPSQPVAEVTEYQDEDFVKVWCLPAFYKDFVDPLYGETYRRLRYGKKFVFDATLVEMGDISMVLRANTKAVTEGSVIFPKVNDKRWWRVEEVKEEDAGCLLYSVITDYQPDFSD